MRDFLEQLSRLWKELGINQKVSLSLAILAVVGVVVGLLVWANRPRLQLLYGGLSPKEMGEVTKAVEALSVPYEIRSGGASIYVRSKDVHTTRMKLASDGIPSGGGVGYEIFDSGSFGISNFVQRTNYIRALQGELARTIDQLDGVRSSKVMIVKPENELLLSGPVKKATASVFVDTGGRALELGAVDSIRSLVANAVEGMSVNDVAVVDNRGNVLSSVLKEEGLMGMTSSQIKYRKSLEDYYTHKVEGMLERVLGPGNVVVRVSVGLDMAAQTMVEESFDPENQIARKETITENVSSSQETQRGGVAGEESNVAGGTDIAGAGGVVSNSQETQKIRDIAYEINRRKVETVRSPGGVNSLSAAVFLAQTSARDAAGAMQPQPRGQEQLDRIRMMVVNALGIESTNADELTRKVTVEEIPFMDVNTMEAGTGGMRDMGSLVDIGRNLLGIAISLFMLLVFFRMVKKSSGSTDHMELMLPDENGVSQAKDVTPTISPELLNELIKQSPDKISSALKNWAFPEN